MENQSKPPARPWTPTEHPGDDRYTSPVVYHGDHQVNLDDSSVSSEEDTRSAPNTSNLEIVRPGPLRFKSSQALRDDALAASKFLSQSPDTESGIPLSLRPRSSYQHLAVDRGDQLPLNNPYRQAQASRPVSSAGLPTVEVHDDTRLPLNNPYRLSQLRSDSTDGLVQRPTSGTSQISQEVKSPEPPAPLPQPQVPVVDISGALPCVTGTSMRSIKILLINPNSTASMTTRCLESIAPTLPPNVTVYGYTPPRPAPTAIESQLDAIMSTAVCAKAVLGMEQYDAYLVACFSHHPLIPALRDKLVQPVVGIMEASLYASRMCGGKFGILTTGLRSAVLHDQSVKTIYGLGGFSVGTESVGLGVLDLENDVEEVQERLAVTARRLQARGADCICLGCAGMTDIQKTCQDAVGMHDRVGMVVDGVAMGVHFLVGLVREGLGTPQGVRGETRSKT